MEGYKIIEVKESVFANNDKQADELRGKLKEQGIFLLNLMSSPGSGKTTTLIEKTGAKVIQLHTGGMCHLDAGMTSQGLESLGTDTLDLVILENIGNLVCPAEFDTGAVKNAMILSVPEGHDKPLKYPLMFSICDALIINKIDVMPYFDFDLDACVKYAKKLNPDIQIFPISAKTGEGMEAWENWLKEQVLDWQKK